MLVTTSYHPSMNTIERSLALAEELNCSYVQREKHSLRRLNAVYHDDQIWVVSNEETKFIDGKQAPLFFHPSSAMVRVKKIINGEQDTLMACSGVSAGDSVLDCTAGLASDSIVFSYTAGVDSNIVSLESEFIPFHIVREGLTRYHTDLMELNEAMRRIQVKQTNHLTYLKQMESKSMDIVYFDPMFRSAIEASQALSPLRVHANHHPISQEAVNEAIRVARKSVVLKEIQYSREFDRLGFNNVFRSYSKIAYGVINCEE